MRTDRLSPAALFLRDGEVFRPTPYTTGPWSLDAMHGGAPSALVGWLVAEAREGDEVVTRVGVDLERPVPLLPLLATRRRRRVSGRVAHLELELFTEAGERVVGARAVLMRPGVELEAPRPRPLAERPEELPSVDWDSLYPPGTTTFVRDATEHRVVRGGYGVPAPSAAWLRLLVPVVAGEAQSTLGCLLGVADFGSPLSLDRSIGEGLALINADVNVTLFREPVGPWFRLEGTSQVGRQGVGLALSTLHDLEGSLGVVAQTQIARRYLGPPAPGDPPEGRAGAARGRG